MVTLRTTINDLGEDMNVALFLAFVIGACNYTCINIFGVLSLENVDDEIAGMFCYWCVCILYIIKEIK